MLQLKLVDLSVVNNFLLLRFFLIPHNLTGKYNLDTDFFQVLTL